VHGWRVGRVLWVGAKAVRAGGEGAAGGSSSRASPGTVCACDRASCECCSPAGRARRPTATRAAASWRISPRASSGEKRGGRGTHVDRAIRAGLAADEAAGACGADGGAAGGVEGDAEGGAARGLLSLEGGLGDRRREGAGCGGAGSGGEGAEGAGEHGWCASKVRWRGAGGEERDRQAGERRARWEATRRTCPSRLSSSPRPAAGAVVPATVFPHSPCHYTA